MKTKLLFLLVIFFGVSSAFAEDVDIYGVSDIDVKPNVLIILDNSGSMGTEDVAGDSYSETETYTGDYTGDAVYVEEDVYTEVCTDRTYEECTGFGRNRTCEWKTEEVCHTEKTGTEWTLYFDDISSSDWQCTTAEEELLSEGHWYGKLRETSGIVNCSQNGSNSDYALGNYLNYLAAGGSADEYRSRMEVAKEVVASLIYENIDSVRLGLMAFNEDRADGSPYSEDYGNGGYVVAECGSTLETLIGSYVPETDAMADSAQSAYGAVGLLKSDTYTPLSETLGEAGLYFAGKTSWFNSTNASYPLGHYSSSCTDKDNSCLDYSAYSPIEYRCQKNYIILVTDGAPTRDDSKFSDFDYIIDEELTESDSDDNTSYLDDVAEFLYTTDIRSDLGETGDFNSQTVSTYTIGFTDGVDANLLTSTANRGGGDYYQATSASQLSQALDNIIAEISEETGNFSAAAVPVSEANNAYAGNYIYYGLFQPTNSGNWYGNLKKYYITDDGVIQDVNGDDVESDGNVVDGARSYWSTNDDGPSTTAGGAGEVLLNRGTERNIYTYTGGTDLELTADSNEFSTDNSTTLNTYTGLTDTVIEAVRIGVSEDWPLGSLLHSQPQIVQYDDTSTIFVGANDGMLHCFDDEDGEELWGFIPQDLLENLSLLESPSSLEYFVDGTPVYYEYSDDTGDKKLLIFGERRGGFSYTALDITSYSEPAFKYSISDTILSDNSSHTEPLGQSWADPQALEMYTYGSNDETTDVFLMAGGYDINQDALPDDTNPALESTDAMGRAVYAVNAQTGELFENFLFTPDNYAEMTHSIIAVSGFENPATRTTTRVYAGDMNGNLFAFRDDIFDYDSEYDYQEDGVWGQKLKLFSVPGQKIWYAPNIVNEYYSVEFTYDDDGTEVTTNQNRVGDYVFFGTGDRAHPERTDILNGFYAIKNSWQWLDENGTPDESPEIIEAYLDNGTVKAKSDDHEITDDEWFILDMTDVSNYCEDASDVKEAINQANNRGWFILLEQDENGDPVGEKVVSSPIIYNGVIYFNTYIPDDGTEDEGDDPCGITGAGGTGYLWAVDYEYGGIPCCTCIEEDDDNPRKEPIDVPGIPPETTVIVQEDDVSAIDGFKKYPIDQPAGLERSYWRELEREL